ncbi:hypothetical protein OG588_09945 [Streptomyces prunicolor]|nr:hypothetical protein OG588_09945 [Streptomyces prunicolor]
MLAFRVQPRRQVWPKVPMGVTDRAQAAAWAREAGLTHPPEA